jgi:hypothetical protein
MGSARSRKIESNQPSDKRAEDVHVMAMHAKQIATRYDMTVRQSGVELPLGAYLASWTSSRSRQFLLRHSHVIVSTRWLATAHDALSRFCSDNSHSQCLKWRVCRTDAWKSHCETQSPTVPDTDECVWRPGPFALEMLTDASRRA